MQKDHGEGPVVTDDAEPPSSVARLTAEIVSAYVANNKIAPSDLAMLISTVASEMAKIGTAVEPSAEEKPEPAVSVRRSIQPDHLVCLVCGKPQKVLKRHPRCSTSLRPTSTARPLGSSSTIRWRPRTTPSGGVNSLSRSAWGGRRSGAGDGGRLQRPKVPD
jgi:hypothetical protein